MGVIPVPRAIFFVCAILPFVAGCGVINNVRQSVPAGFSQIEAKQVDSRRDVGALVVLRWPAIITPAAASLIAQRYLTANKDLLPVGQATFFRPGFEKPDAWQEIPIKSTYYIAEFARVLSQYVPADRILLQPMIVDADAAGSISLQAMSEISVPTTVTVNFVANPGAVHMAAEGTAGQYLFPTVSVATALEASPDTYGALLTTEVLAYPRQAPAGTDNPGSASAHDGLHSAFLEAMSPAFSPLEAGVLPRKATPPMQPNSIVEFPHVAYNMTAEEVRRTAAAGFAANAGSIRNAYLDSLSKTIAQGLAVIDREAAARAGLAGYAAHYDERLALAIGVGDELTKDQETRLRVIAKLANAEAVFRNKQDERFVEAVLNGDFGKSYRTLRVAEVERSSNLFAQDMIASASILAMGMTSGAATGTFFSPDIMQRSFATIEQSEAAQADIRQSFYEQFAPTVGEQQRFVIQIANEETEITAGNVGELREKMARLYRKKFGQ